LAKEVRFHGKRYPWFVSDVTRKDWNWLLNTMVYGQLFDKASDQELRSLKKLGMRWKVRRQQLPCAGFDNDPRVSTGIREAREMGKHLQMTGMVPRVLTQKMGD